MCWYFCITEVIRSCTWAKIRERRISELWKSRIDVEYIYGFFWWGSASKVDDVTALPSRHKMTDMCYYGNVMTTTRWWLCVTMATLWQQQDGDYALLFYIFNSTVIDWTCFFFGRRFSIRTMTRIFISQFLLSEIINAFVNKVGLQKHR